jgi:hypothetical protein
MDPDPQTGGDATDPDLVRSSESSDEGEPSQAGTARSEDDSPVERYRDSPGMGVIDPSKGVPEPNEPG